MEDLESALDVKLVDQDELESSITQKANRALLSKDSELDEKRLAKAKTDYDKVARKIKLLQLRLDNPRTKISQRKLLRDEIAWFEANELAPLKQDIQDIETRLQGNKDQLNAEIQTKSTGDRRPDESERDFLVRTGKLTAFGTSSAFASSGGQSHQNLRAPGFMDDKRAKPEERANSTTSITPSGIKVKEEILENDGNAVDLAETASQDILANDPEPHQMTVKQEQLTDEQLINQNDPYLPSDDSDVQPRKRHRKQDSDYEVLAESDVEQEPEPEPESPISVEDSPTPESSFSNRNTDDGIEEVFQQRLGQWVSTRSKLRRQEHQDDDPNVAEWFKPHPTIPDAVLDSKFRLPGDVHPSLFDYQKTGVQWLWELYSQKTGGIIGDEMGLGKTIQVIAFVAGLHYSGLLDKPVLLVVPATVMNQWVNEFHRWWPPLRCVILHSIGLGMSKSSIKSELELESHLEAEEDGDNAEISLRAANNQINAKEIVDRVLAEGHVLVTTYVGLRIYSKYILPHEWGYAVLDEGHKIRNPNSEILLACKRIKTYNRIILSGTPIQNNLIELWSLFDFVFPGRLGTLPVFERQFAIPINMGGYANATNVQVQTGYKCAVILRDLISPYLLRRLKVDVAQDLPKKNEMVLFVKLTQFQQDLYEKFLGSEDVNAILGGRRNVLMGVDMLRKICNHPDLVDRDVLLRKQGYSYGNPAKSGKMQVVKKLLHLWQFQGHRTLLFCQTKQMLDILEKFLANLRTVDADGNDSGDQFHYLRMDGLTPIAKRQQLVDTFNTNLYYHVFLLTTKVGGLGVNLTGADRVIIYDPDWNPSTDIQARERAWRLGQKKDITIYRLMTAGTIEEKIYHRQIFKTFLTNKILKDPKQRRFFKLNDLHDLFTLGDPDEKGTETGDMFNGSEQTYGGEKERKPTRLSKAHKNDDDFYQVANIMGVSKLDKFEGDAQEKKNDRNEEELMEGLFSNAGVVHSMLQHDEIVDSSQQEESIVEKEANRLAKEAADALKKSRMLARKTAVGTPTWTGKFGAAGRFGPKNKTKSGIKRNLLGSISRLSLPISNSPTPSLSSTSILSELRQRKSGDSTKFSFGESNSAKSDSKSLGEDKRDLLAHIVDFLSKKEDGFSKSNEILNSLPKSVNLKNEREVMMVRSLLREAAIWQTKEKGWKLKDNYLSKDQH